MIESVALGGTSERARYCIAIPPKTLPAPPKRYVRSGPNFSPRRLDSTPPLLSASAVLLLSLTLPSNTSLPFTTDPSENTAKMGYDKIDTLAINTIRTLAVSLLRDPNGGARSAVLSLHTQQRQSSSSTTTTINTHADIPPRWTPPSSPTLATPVRPWAWPRS